MRCILVSENSFHSSTLCGFVWSNINVWLPDITADGQRPWFFSPLERPKAMELDLNFQVLQHNLRALKL